MGNIEGNHDTAKTNSEDASNNALFRSRLSWERMPIFLRSNDGGEGTEQLTMISQVIGCDATGLPRNLKAENPRGKASQLARVRYYDVARHWTRRIEPYLGDETGWQEYSLRV